MKKLNYYQVHTNKKPRLNKKSKLFYKCFFKGIEKDFYKIKKAIFVMRNQAKELAKKHVDTKPIKYLLK